MAIVIEQFHRENWPHGLVWTIGLQSSVARNIQWLLVRFADQQPQVPQHRPFAQ
jgi:hypothetical protein